MNALEDIPEPPHPERVRMRFLQVGEDHAVKEARVLAGTTIFDAASWNGIAIDSTCGAGNTSFGLPGRHTLGAAFLAVAQSHGLTSAIMDARSQEIVEAVRATDFLLGHDEWGAAWIAAFRKKQAAAAGVGLTEPSRT